MNNGETLGQRIKRVREQRGWSQGALAMRSKVSQSMVSMAESDDREPRTSTFVAIARALDVSLDWLATGEMRTPEELQPDEQALIEAWRAIDSDSIKAFLLNSARDAARKDL